jgi:hypothetical protein
MPVTTTTGLAISSVSKLEAESELAAAPEAHSAAAPLDLTAMALAWDASFQLRAATAAPAVLRGQNMLHSFRP